METPLTVSQLTTRLKAAMEPGFRSVFLEGEITNISRSNSGHLYFSLKDQHSVLSAALFGRTLDRLGLDPDAIRNGTKARARGQIEIYAARGTYSLIVQALEIVGKGSLQEQFEALKKKLQAEGLFASSRKRKLPRLPQRIGIIGSPESAAIRDILSILKRRFPNLHIIIHPVLTQGAAAAKDIAAAIQLMNRSKTLDVLIVTRGGGSLEDLWSFNEEMVARAIAASRLPVIAGVGHESDLTIAGLVADVRAPTPSAAAELLVGRKDEFSERFENSTRRLQAALRQAFSTQAAQLNEQAFRLNSSVTRRLNETHRQLDDAQARLTRRLVTLAPENRNHLDRLQSQLSRRLVTLVPEERNHLDRRQTHLAQSLTTELTRLKTRTQQSAVDLEKASQVLLNERRQKLTRLEGQLRLLSPLNVLERGFSITRSAEGDVIRRASDVKKSDAISTLLADGEIESTVINSTSSPPE